MARLQGEVQMGVTPNSEFYWGTVRGKGIQSYSGTFCTDAEELDIERYEAALVARYGAPMQFRVTQLGKVTAINGYDPKSMPGIPAVMMCVAKLKDLPEDEPELGPPLQL